MKVYELAMGDKVIDTTDITVSIAHTHNWRRNDEFQLEVN